MLQTWTFTISQNVLRCLLLHLLRIVFASFALEHSPCARMIWTLTTILILFRRLRWRIDALLLEGKQRVSPFYHGSESCFPRTATIRSHKSGAGIPSNLNPASKEMISESWTVWNWGLLLTHPTYWNKCMTSKNAQCSTRRRFLSPQDLLQNRSLERVPAYIVFQHYPHNNTVCIHMCDECKISIDSGVLPQDLGSFCDWSCKLIHWP